MAKIITELSGGGGSGIHNDLAGLNEGDYLHLTQAEKDNLLTGEGFVPYVGATTNVDLGEYQIKAEQLELDQTPTGAFSTAKIRWNDTAGTAEIRLKGNNVTLQLGQELVKRVVNKTATNITLLESNYQVVKIIGAIGQRLSVDLAQANSEINSATTLGLVTENISNNQEGFVTFSGEINLINTTGSLQGETWVDGDVLYLSPMVAGQLTKVVPIAPNHTVRVGYVQHSHITQGKLHVDIDRGYSIDNLHNVKITGTTDNKIIGSTTEGLWENKTVDDILGYTPENITNKVSTISGISETEYPNEKAVVDYVDSKLPSDYATVVYVDTNDPNTATIFDDVNPPVTNDPLLEDDVDNLYIGADSSTWVFNGTTYTTEIVPDNSNFFLNGVSVDAGNNKTGAIGRLGSITSQEAVSDTSNNSGSTLGQRGLSFFKWLSGVATFGRIKWDNIGANVTFQLPNTADNSTETFAMVSDVDGKQNQLTAGANITIDVTDPLAPVISSTGGGTPSLQDVTTIGSTTTVPIVVTNYEENAITGISAEAFGVNGQSTSGIGVLGQSTNSVAGRFSIPSGNTSNIAEFLKNNVIQASVSHLGDFTANSLIKSGATSDDVLLGDGSTTSLAGIGGGTLDTVPTDGSTNGVESNGVFDALATKQATLVSATNIKTINGSSILGSGDLVVGSAGSTDLGYTASPTDGTVTSSTGTDATVPLADGTNAGLLKPADFTQLSTLVSDLSAKAPLSSPALTGTPTAPTATVGTNTTQLATTAFVLANTSPNTTYSEVPTGTINGVNTTFILANTPSNAAAVIAIINGVTQYNGIDFTVSGSTITFTTAPTTGSTVYVYYNVSSGSSGGSGSTNLAYTPSPTNGIVTSDTGADATLPLADNTNAGLLKPADFTQLSGLVSALALKAPLASPTFTGTVSGITKTMVGLGNVDNTSDVNKPISTATQTALNGKQNTITLTTTGTSGASTLVGSTLNIPQYVGSGGSGTVTSVAVTTANGISGTVSNPNTTPAITLSMQDATTSQSGRLTSTDWNTFNNKQSTLVSGTNIKTVNGNSILGSGNLVVSGLGTVTSLSATDSTGIDFTITNPTTTPNISLALTKDAVSLSNVDNTSDINKPVSTAQQTALNLKADLASPALTGTPTAPTATVGTNTTQLATTAFVLANAGGGSSPYLKYVALISQTGTGAPTAITLENTLGVTITFSRTSTGSYTLTASTAIFDFTKTTIVLSGILTTPVTTVGYVRNSASIFGLFTRNITTETPVDSVLYYTPIEIRVYP